MHSFIENLKFFFHISSLDSFFTERYMPYDNDHLLRSSDLAEKAKELNNKRFLIVQGTADVVVHQQHSLWLAKSLIQEAVTFRQQVKNIFKVNHKAFCGVNSVLYCVSDIC